MRYLLATIKLFSILLVLMQFSGCSTVSYYSQAISGHFELLSRQRPIVDVLEDETTSSELKVKLELSQQARVFASEKLLLPDNDSYKQYADLERPFVVWNVVATPAYSIKPRQWCFFIVGCLSYRGIFDKQEAEELVEQLKQQGMDVSVFGSAAYSTLGYFDDPLLNTMMRHGDANLIGVIFHELAHQRIYVENDTAFNEAFATAVEQEGLRRWFQEKGESGQYENYLQKKQYRHEFYSLITTTRRKLDSAFKTAETDEEKQKRKQSVYNEFKQDYKIWREERKYYAFDNWMQRDLNNSHLALIATYQDLVPNFINLLASADNDIEKFYQLVASIAEKDKETRSSLLALYKGIKTSSR